ncbi:Pkinase domain containing protein [Pyrenophora tritici-repentis]|uniref:Pkinase domain containing protein n=1 Tax=Pyrenophora tritici-repentis TaxID=45151 RepID=A0A2W1FN94_9PLEO|nr:Pkinase domain-containing protein [Pyrenophora tritici-repentis]KAF7565229.1 Pkinase domain containing protein [Pyrenophora tritici-repentis]KAI1522894.1 Pkinase domain containing protein [Pyrenophora tritici-repentis]KAI1561603.1 Pkinase domain containing protein [Pyrenophora tritici-repentis]KAI1680295.1 Protein kinase domain containing protein [Pyrenophora tritici-repentis]
MATKAIEEAFQRHPRPQVPTKAALLQKALEKSQQISTAHREIHDSPWKTLVRQGNLVQGKYVWSICVYKSQLVLVKEMTIQAGRDELEKMKKLSDHPHVSTIRQAFETESSLFLQLEYSRYTLEEVLNVHTRLEEPHIPNFEESIQVTTESTPNRDLECLGIVVLQCMNGTPKKELRDLVEIRRLRESNKTFGLDNGGKWSGYKLLVDFLDNMFNANVPASAKLEKPHRFIESEPNYGILLPFLELVSLECFALWHAAAVKS